MIFDFKTRKIKKTIKLEIVLFIIIIILSIFINKYQNYLLFPFILFTTVFVFNKIVDTFNICKHKFIMHEEINIINKDNIKTGKLYVLQCDKCGYLKNKQV